MSARSRTETNLRDAKYTNFARQWLSDVPAIGLYQSTVQYVHTANVRALAPDAVLVSGLDRYQNVLYWTVGTERVFQTP